MSKTFTRWDTALKGLGLGALLLGAAALPAAAQTAYGIAIGAALGTTPVYSLVTFQVTAPGTFTATAVITGLAAGQSLVGIDSRPATGQIFALGYNDEAATNNAQLYTLSTAGVLTPVGGSLTLALGNNAGRIGFDFNPTVDRIRVTGSNGGNYRLNPNNGAIAATDGALAYAAADPNNGRTPSVGSSAYTNSYIGSSATTLYNIDEAASRLVRQDPPNAGTLNTVGTLSVLTDSEFQGSDLDIYFNPTTGQNVAYLSVSTATVSALPVAFSVSNQLYTLNLSTGATTAVGQLGNSSSVALADITLAITRPTLASITGQLAYALAGTNLITFDTALPGTIRTATGITGVDASQTLVGLDVRPINNALYALGYNAAAASGVNNSQLYSLDATTGAATAVGAAFRLELGTGSVGFDFNPTVDRIRVVGANRNNYRLNPNSTAASVLAATDGPVSYTSGTPNIGAVAYTNSFRGASSTSGTTLYNYDLTLNQLNIQSTANPPSDGQLTAVGSSGLTVNSTTPYVDLDIYSTGAGNNMAYLVANTGTALGTTLYTVNLATGATTQVGAIGNGAVAARNIAVAAATGVTTGTRPAELATALTLYPNPLASATSLSFGLPRTAHVELTVTDALGRTVDHLDAGQLPAGSQTVRWQRQGQAAGLYFFRLAFDGQPAGTRQVSLTQ